MICVIILFNEMKILIIEINGETQVDIVLKALLDSFMQFKFNYNMNKIVTSLTKLMSKLQMAKGILRDQKDIHMIVKGFLGSSSQKKKNTIEFAKQKRKFKGKRKKKKSKGQNKCFLCGLKFHWKKEYPKFLKRQSSMHHYLLAESCLVLDSTNSWWTDSKATTHVCNSLQGFQLRRS